MQSAKIYRIYERPALRKLSPAKLKEIVLNHAREFLELIFPGQTNLDNRPAGLQSHRKYSQPALRKLTPAQAKLLLIGHASTGDQGAKDILELLFPKPGGSVPEGA